MVKGCGDMGEENLRDFNALRMYLYVLLQYGSNHPIFGNQTRSLSFSLGSPF